MVALLILGKRKDGGNERLMRIEFINAVIGGDFSAMDISITALATFLNQRSNHQAGIIDLVFHRRDWKSYLHRTLDEKRPDWVGISTNTMYMSYCRQVMQEVKKHNIPIILGGHHASTHPEETLAIPEVDAVCIGDGEYALREFLERQKYQIYRDATPGMWMKDSGKQIRNSGGSFIENLDSLPFLDWSLWQDLDKYFYYLGMLYVIFSRGCPYRCAFCDAWGIASSVQGPYYRQKNPELSAYELFYYWSTYRKRGLRLAQVFDPVCTLDEEWVIRFCEKYGSYGSPLPFSVFSRIDNLNETKIKALARANCKLLRVGIESGDEHIRNDVYKKKISNEQIREVFGLCKKQGIGFTAFYILGGPGETRQTIKKTIDMAVELDANRTAFFVYKPFTKEAATLVEELGGTIDTARWQKADNITFGAVIRSKDLSPRRVELLQAKAYFLTFGRRLLRLITKYRLHYFVWLLAYMLRGMHDGLDWKYLITYYHIYQGPYVKE
jgi:anaerobic magnesium-protoporphyrin IX monomethyl ester cyclase